MAEQYVKIYDNMLVSVDEKYKSKDGVFIIPEGIEFICDDCFKNNNSIRVVKCPSSLKTIGKNAFESSDIEVIYLNDGLEEIREFAFREGHLLSVSLPDSLKYLGMKAFEKCYQLQSVNFGKGIHEISEGCFNSCSNLSHLVIPDTIYKISKKAFCSCNLYNVELGKNVKELAQQAFDDNYITNFDVPANLTEFYCSSFNILRLKKLNFHSIDSLYTFMLRYYLNYNENDYKKHNSIDIDLSFVDKNGCLQNLYFYYNYKRYEYLISVDGRQDENNLFYCSYCLGNAEKNIRKFIEKLKKRYFYKRKPLFNIKSRVKAENIIDNNEQLILENSHSGQLILEQKSFTSLEKINNSIVKKKVNDKLAKIRVEILTDELVDYINNFINDESLKLKNADELLSVSKDLQIRLLELEKIYLLGDLDKYSIEFNKLNEYCHSQDFIIELISILAIKTNKKVDEFIPWTSSENNDIDSLKESKGVSLVKK